MSNPSSFLYAHPLLVILGHYGSGKTNLALNLALQLRKAEREPVLIDLDVVNPYFRSTDFLEQTSAEGIRVFGPVFGNSNLDAPSLAPGIDAMISEASLAAPVILDVGGDPDGARALARYAPAINAVRNKLVAMVVNLRRPETRTVTNNLTMLRELEERSSVAVTGLIGNTHLAEFTTPEIILESVEPLRELSEQSGVPLTAITVPQELLEQGDTLLDTCAAEELFPLQRLVKTNWQ